MKVRNCRFSKSVFSWLLQHNEKKLRIGYHHSPSSRHQEVYKMGQNPSLRSLPRHGQWVWLWVWESFWSVLSTWWVSNSEKNKSLKHKHKISIDHMSLLLNDALLREKNRKKPFGRSLSLCILTPLVNCIIKINKV